MKQMQFAAILLMALLTLKLLLLPRHAVSTPSVNKSRWLMAGGTALLCVQFLLQYALELRTLGVTQAVMLNLTMFIPASALLSLSVLYLQGEERVNFIDKYIWLCTWAIAMALLTLAVFISNMQVFADSQPIRYAEIGASIFYAAMQTYYSVRNIKYLRSVRHTLSNYYDHETDDLLLWMKYSFTILALLALFVPALIFGHGWWLAAFGTLFLVGICYLVDNFCSYIVSSASRTVMEAEQAAREEAGETEAQDDQLSPEAVRRVEDALTEWIASDGHLRSGTRCTTAADEMHLPRYLLSRWLRQNGYNYNEWINKLRIDEAKHQLMAHPDWSNEAVAHYCGFTDRTYFQRKFKEKTGFTPAAYQATLR